MDLSSAATFCMTANEADRFVDHDVAPKCTRPAMREPSLVEIRDGLIWRIAETGYTVLDVLTI